MIVKATTIYPEFKSITLYRVETENQSNALFVAYVTHKARVAHDKDFSVFIISGQEVNAILGSSQKFVFN